MVKNPAILQLLAAFQAGRPPSSDIQDRTQKPTVGPYLPQDLLADAGPRSNPLAEFLLTVLAKQKNPYWDKPPVYFPPNSDLGRLQRRFGASPSPPNRVLR